MNPRYFFLAIFILLSTGTARANEAPSAGVVALPDFLLRTCVEETTNASGNDEQRAAISACTAVIQRPGNNIRTQAVALSMRGLAEASLDDNKTAILDFSNALAILPDFPLALYGRAGAYLDNNENAKAVADDTRLLNEGAGPLTAKAYVTRGDAYNNLMQYDLGINDFDKALKADPNDAEAMNDRAWAMERQGHFAEALQGYNAALAVPSNMQDTIYDNRSETELMLGQIQAARQDCQAAQIISPGSSETYSCFGLLDLKTKDYAKAVSDYTAALAGLSANDWVLYPRGIARIALGQVKAGEADIEAGEKAWPNSKSYYAGLGITPPAGF
jgi:tetratricopeptide (TPR) repeat protein